MNVTDSLKELYVAFGGEAADIDTLTNITYVANAISALLGGDSNATNVADAIENISVVAPSGGGNTDTATLDALINRSITEINNDRVTTVGPGAFSTCPSLTTVNLPSVTNIEINAFVSCPCLTTINLPVVTEIGLAAFGGCARLTKADFPLLERIRSSAFFRCGMLTTLVLRRNTVATLEHTDAFTNTPIASGTGYIYVPDDQVDSYKTATNWVTYASQIKPISELEETA